MLYAEISADLTGHIAGGQQALLQTLKTDGWVIAVGGKLGDEEVEFRMLSTSMGEQWRCSQVVAPVAINSR